MTEPEVPSRRRQVLALWEVTKYRPISVVGIIGLGVVTAVLEGFGLGFIVPIVKFAQTPDFSPAEADGALGVFVSVYEFVGLPFTLEYLTVGVVAVMTLRFSSTFVLDWVRSWIQTDYERKLKTDAFEAALDANIAYFDEEGSDEILNAIITQTRYAGRSIQRIVQIVEQSLLSLMYLSVAIYLVPVITTVSIIAFGSIAILLRTVTESGQELGDAVAEANESVQSAVQAGTQGVRDVRLFNLATELRSNFEDAIGRYTRATIASRRNQSALQNFFQLLSAVALFVLLYVILQFTTLSLSALGVYLFAVFRLATQGSNVLNLFYRLELNIPHLVRTQRFVDELQQRQRDESGTLPAPAPVDTVRFDEVCFSYRDDEEVLSDISFQFERGEFVGFVGESGAGKSTIAALLSQLYRPDSGEIRADGTPLADIETASWRERIAVVRQSPYIFDDTLAYNITVGRRSASREEVEAVCETAQITEFLDDLPDGLDTRIGDDGVRLSGGQRQRVALARALLKDADILILDEATSDLDTRIERDVQNAIESMDREYGILSIAHRLSTVKNADRIYTVEDGEITEQGTHDELLAAEGKYADLYLGQVGA